MSSQKFTCVVVEDEQHTTRLMKKYISQIDQLVLLACFVSPLELINSELLAEVDIIYLDIQMPNMTGMEFLSLTQTKAEVILTTAYSEYALDGYEHNVIDYLLKPVDFPRFVKASKKAIEQRILKSKARDTNKNNQKDEYLMLKVDKKLVRIYKEDIVYIQSDWNYLHVYTKTEKFMVLGTMKNIEATLSNDEFIRIHKSYLINHKYFEYLEGNQVLINGIKLQVSRNYKQDLINFFKK